MTKKRTQNYYRLVQYNPNDGSIATDYASFDDKEAIERASDLMRKNTHNDMANLYKYCYRDTAGPFKFLKTIKEPKATE